eukprot:2637303-Rhodomonas_salina.1
MRELCRSSYAVACTRDVPYLIRRSAYARRAVAHTPGAEEASSRQLERKEVRTPLAAYGTDTRCP